MQKIKIINFLITPIKISKLINKIHNLTINKKKSYYICVSSVHGAIESYFNNYFKIAHNNADIALPDGRPIYWALKILSKKDTDHLPGYFVTNKICELANKKKLNLGIYGSTNSVQQKFIKKINNKYKKIKFKYLYSPPFRKLSTREKIKIVNSINKSKVDILFVALGAPKQELWMYKNKKNLRCVMIGIGAAIDFISGNKRLPPKIFEKLGFNWLFRLISEPRRLFWRYFSTNVIFIFLFFLQLTKIKKY